MSRRLVLGLTWLAATVIAVFVALQAVGAIGDQVTNTPTAASRGVGNTTSTSTTTAAPPASAPVPSTSTTTAASVAPAAVPSAPDEPTSDPAVAASSPGPDPASDPGQGQDQEREQPAVEDQPAAAPAPGPTSSYNLEGGSIGVRCTGSTIELVYSSPAQGFGSDVNSAGPEEVDVRFESDSHRSRIRVQCTDGHPVVTDQREEPG